MNVDTISDLVAWSSQFHYNLADFIQSSVASSKDERAKMLGDYLAGHERELGGIISAFESVESNNALGTWCTEFLNQKPLPDVSSKDDRLAVLSANELMDEIREIHEQFIALYSHILNLSAATPAADMLAQLVDVETHQLMLMTHSANRLEDL